MGKTAERHTSEQFVQFMESIVADHDETQHIHVICDNVSTRKTDLVQTWLLFTPNVHIHYTPTYSQILQRFCLISAANPWGELATTTVPRKLLPSLMHRMQTEQGI